jgi:hypothetical protein
MMRVPVHPSVDGMRTRIASRLFTAVRHRDPCTACELSLISNFYSLFRFLGNFDVNHWNHRVIAFAGFVNRSKTTVFPVIFPVNKEFPWRRVRSRLQAPPPSLALWRYVVGALNQDSKPPQTAGFLRAHPRPVRSELERTRIQALFWSFFSVRHFRSTVLYLAGRSKIKISIVSGRTPAFHMPVLIHSVSLPVRSKINQPISHSFLSFQ